MNSSVTKTEKSATELEALEEQNETLFEIAGLLRTIKNAVVFFAVLAGIAILVQGLTLLFGGR